MKKPSKTRLVPAAGAAIVLMLVANLLAGSRVSSRHSGSDPTSTDDDTQQLRTEARWHFANGTTLAPPAKKDDMSPSVAASYPKSGLVNVTSFSNGSVLIGGRFFKPEPLSQWDTLLKPSDPMFWLYCFLVFLCVISAAFAAGMTMGLVSVDAMKLHVTLETDIPDDEETDDLHREEACQKALRKKRAELLNNADCNEAEIAGLDAELLRVSNRIRDKAYQVEMRETKASAKKILPVIQQHHLLLVTLLLTNAVANECMPIFLDRLVPSWLAVCLSVTFVLIFGEIVPSAVFTGKHQLHIASIFTPLVQALMLITSPISYPISVILDLLFGKEEHEAYNKEELKAFIRMHGHREQHQAVVVVRPHPDCSIPPAKPPSNEELEHARSDAKILHMTDAFGRLDPHNARFSTSTETEFRRWLEQLLLPGDFYPAHDFDVLMHPLSSERRDMNKPRAHIGFASLEDAQRVCDIINQSLPAIGGGAWMHGWVRVEAELAESQHSLRMQKLADDECAILCGVIEIGETSAGEAAHQMEERTDDGSWRIFMLSHNTILDRGVLAEVMRRGHSRIPIYQVKETRVCVDSVEFSDEKGMPRVGIQLGYDLTNDAEDTWGSWNKVRHVEAGSPAAAAGIDTQMFVCAVNGVRVKKPEDYETEMKKAENHVMLTVFRDQAEDRRRICGMLLTKKLLVLSPEDYRMVGDVTERFPLAIAPDNTLLEALSGFRQGGSHMAIVTNNPSRLQECWNVYRRARLPDPNNLSWHSKKHQKADHEKPDVDPLEWAAPIVAGEVEVLGLLTLEDVLEEFMGDIRDETDARDELALPAAAKRVRLQKIATSIRSRQTVTPLLRTPTAPHYAHSLPSLPSLRGLRTPASSGITSRLTRGRVTSNASVDSAGVVNELTPLLDPRTAKKTA